MRDIKQELYDIRSVVRGVLHWDYLKQDLNYVEIKLSEILVELELENEQQRTTSVSLESA